MTVGKSDPALRRGPGSGAPGAGGAHRGRPGERRCPTPPNTPACRPNWTALQGRLTVDAEEAKIVTDWLVSGIAAIKKLYSGAKRLSEGLSKLEGGGQETRPRLRPPGSGRVAARRRPRPGWKPARPRSPAASHELGGGADALGQGLADGFRRSAPLQSGLRRASVRVVSNDAKLTRQARRLQRTTPGLFDSGYFVLSALDGARPAAPRASGRSDRPERRRPGGDDAGHLPLHLQLARLDRPQQAARRRTRPSSVAKPG